ncbi:MAG: hypothetical protein HGA38_00265 [Candidatus Moranbacteria bacterium]|nr:hypothetical protein [Candidatus Moranbacteria bacterium]NTW45970.1 hypothetical protein [Candidatus Moranbacteria bacterium]
MGMESHTSAGAESEAKNRESDRESELSHEPEKFRTVLLVTAPLAAATLQYVSALFEQRKQKGTVDYKEALMNPEVLTRMKDSGLKTYDAMGALEGVVEEQRFDRFETGMRERIDAAGSEEEKERLLNELKQLKTRRDKEQDDAKKRKEATGNLLRALFGVQK